MIEPIAVYYEHCEVNWSVPLGRIGNHIMLLMTDGQMEYRIGDRTFVLRRGDALYVPRGAVRSAHNKTYGRHEMYVAHFQYEEHAVPLPLLGEGIPRSAFIHNDAYFKQRFSMLTQQWLRKNKYYEVLCHSMLLELLTLLNIETSHREDPAANNLVLQIQEYIATRYREKIVLDELARLVDRTPNYVSTVFHHATGLTITEYTQQIRMAAARDLLTNSQMTIGEISNYLGFCEQSYFNRVFKKAAGVPPSAFIKEIKSQNPAVGAVEYREQEQG